MEILRLSPLTITASIAYAGGSKNIWIAMILCFCTSLFHFDFFTKYTMSILQSGVLAKESLKNSYQLGIIASACFSRGLFNVFKSSSALEKNKRILISALITLAAFVIMLFVPSSDIKDSRNWSETFAFLVAAWILERALTLVGTLPRHGMLIHLYNVITRVFIVRAVDTVRVASTMPFFSSNGIAAYGVFVTYSFFALIFAHTCLRRVYDACQHYSTQDVSVILFLSSALVDTTRYLVLSGDSTNNTNVYPHAMLCITLNLLVLFISIKVQRPKINPKSESGRFHRIWVDQEEKCNWSEDARFLVDFEECKAKIHDIVSNAKRTVYYSTFLCDFEFPLLEDSNKEETMANVLNRLARNGVEVYILYNPGMQYGNKPIQYIRNMLDSRIRITTAKTNLELSTLSRSTQRIKVCGYHHQKYICVDDKIAMVCGCDINGERAGWLVKNCMGYYWDEIATVLPCSERMSTWFRSNFETPHKVESPFPLLSGGLREHDAMVHLIRTAEYELYFANQTLLTGNEMYVNKIGHALVDRIVRARHERKPFQIMLLTNESQNDEPGFWTQIYCRYSPMLSLMGIEEYALDCGISLQELYEYFYIATLRYDGVIVKVHSNLLVADQDRAIRSSGNLSDRCFSDKPTDSELGVMMKGQEVKLFMQYHFRRLLPDYDGDVDQELTLLDLRRAAERNMYGCLIQRCSSPLLDEPFMNREIGRAFMYFLTAMSEGATGGKEMPIWEIERY